MSHISSWEHDTNYSCSRMRPETVVENKEVIPLLRFSFVVTHFAVPLAENLRAMKLLCHYLLYHFLPMNPILLDLSFRMLMCTKTYLQLMSSHSWSKYFNHRPICSESETYFLPLYIYI